MKRVKPIASFQRSRWGRAIGASSLVVISAELVLILALSQVAQQACWEPPVIVGTVGSPETLSVLV